MKGDLNEFYLAEGKKIFPLAWHSMQAIAFVYGFDQNLGVVDAILVQSYSVLFLVCLLKNMREEKERKSFNFFLVSLFGF